MIKTLKPFKNKRPSPHALVIATKRAFDDSLKELQELSDNHFNIDTEKLNWSGAAQVAFLHQILEEASNKIFDTIQLIKPEEHTDD